MDLLTVVTQNTRSDDYVNATAWCSKFDKELKRFMHLKQTKEYIRVLKLQLRKDSDVDAQNVPVDVIKREKSGRTFESWVHPLLAIKLAEWLSPEFEVYVKDIFKRYLQADMSLAKDITARNNGIFTRKQFTQELVNRGAKQYTFAKATNAIYVPLFGMTAQELKEELETATTRNALGRTELAAIALAESMAMDEMEDTNAKGHTALVQCASQAGVKVARAFD
jgi:hypothetical protein